jgi:hypothetical protein
MQHHAMGLHRPVEAVEDLRQDTQPGLAISAAMVGVLEPITPGSDVVEGISEFKTKRAGHARFLAGM